MAEHATAAKVVSVLSWAQIAVPIAAVVVTIPASLYLLVFGGIIIVAPPIALGVVGLGLRKSLRAGHRVGATIVWALTHIVAYVALALHSRTWDARTDGQARFFVLCQVVFWLAAATHLSVPIILGASARTPPETPGDAKRYPELKPALWPWLLGGLLILGSIVLGIATAAKA